MHVALSGVTDVAAAVAHDPELAALAHGREAALVAIGNIGRAHDYGAPADLPAIARHFDRLAATTPDLGVAAYALGDPALLAQFTAEVVAVVRDWAGVAGRDVLDLGCGAGRVAGAIVAEARSVTGVDVSPGMVARARERVPAARFMTVNGAALCLADHSIDVALAVDSFPFVVQAGLVEATLAEIARVLRPGGDLLVFNWSYGDATLALRQARAAPFTLLRGPERPFARWDATAFHLRG